MGRVGQAFIALVALWVALLAGGCDRPPQQLLVSGPTMGTTYSVKVASLPEGVDEDSVSAAIEEILGRVDRSMSGYRDDSEISRFNAAAVTDWIPVSNDLATVVDYALSVSRESGGAFDITVAPLVAAWGFGAAGEPEVLPNEAELAELKTRTGYPLLQARMEPPALRKENAALIVDLNAIAPGYAVDLLAARLRAMRIDSFMIDIGGEVLARGRNWRGETWRIAVERPVDAKPEAYAILQLDNAAVTTSGEYRRYYDRDGRRYSHTIDPRTGRPVEHSLASVVVVGPTSMHTDAWATAFNVLGTRAGHELATRLRMPVLFIDAQGQELRSIATAQFEPYVVQR